MKKLIKISQMNMFLLKSTLFIAILFFSQINVFAHGKVDVKTTTTNNGSTTKYTSKAHVSKTGVLANKFSSVHTQNPCWEGSAGVASVSLDNCAYQTARYCYKPILQGAVYKRWCARGGINTNLVPKAFGFGLLQEQDSYLTIEESYIETGNPIIKAGAVLIPNIEGYIQTRGPGMLSYFEIVVWRSSNGDTTHTPQNTLTRARIGLFDEQVQAEGAFLGLEIPSTVTGQLSRIDFNGLDAILPVPGLLPTNDDEIIVSFISHADAIESSPEETEIQLNSAIQSSNENLEKSQTVFNVGYSPSNQSIDITYRDILSEGYTISLYNDRGVLIKTIYYYESETSNLAQMMRIDISDLGLMKGIYFVALEKENSISIKKIYIP